MLLDSSVIVTYENTRGFSIPLIPTIAEPINNVYQLNRADEYLPNDIFSEREVGWHGENVQAMFMGSREVTLEIDIHWDPKNPDLIHSYKRAIARTFNLDLTGRLTYNRKGNRRSFFLDGCRVKELPRIREGNGFIRCIVILIASDPFWREKTELERLSFTQKNIFFPWSVRPIKYMGVKPKEPKTYHGLKRSELSKVVTNKGDVATGFKVVFHANGEVKNPFITNMDTGQFIKIVGNPGDFTMQKGDEIQVISFPKERKIYLQNGERGARNLLEGSKYFLLPVGTTKMGFGADLNVSLLDVLLYYTPLYLGAEN